VTDPFERLQARDAFAELLARTTENVVALTKIGFDMGDLTVRNLRMAGRTDIARLSTSLARLDDKLERVLQEVESLRDDVAATRAAAQPVDDVAAPGDDAR
jgi:methyl-accepting chemotaxis protein